MNPQTVEIKKLREKYPDLLSCGNCCYSSNGNTRCLRFPPIVAGWWFFRKSVFPATLPTNLCGEHRKVDEAATLKLAQALALRDKEQS